MQKVAVVVAFSDASVYKSLHSKQRFQLPPFSNHSTLNSVFKCLIFRSFSVGTPPQKRRHPIPNVAFLAPRIVLVAKRKPKNISSGERFIAYTCFKLIKSVLTSSFFLLLWPPGVLRTKSAPRRQYLDSCLVHCVNNK